MGLRPKLRAIVRIGRCGISHQFTFLCPFIPRARTLEWLIAARRTRDIRPHHRLEPLDQVQVWHYLLESLKPAAWRRTRSGCGGHGRPGAVSSSEYTTRHHLQIGVSHNLSHFIDRQSRRVSIVTDRRHPSDLHDNLTLVRHEQCPPCGVRDEDHALW